MPYKPASPCTMGCGRKAVARGRCQQHMRSTIERGYGADHKRRRAADQLAIRQGRGICWRCLKPITPDEPWHLGHDDNNRDIYRGPEHQHCNTQAAAKRLMSH